MLTLNMFQVDALLVWGFKAQLQALSPCDPHSSSWVSGPSGLTVADLPFGERLDASLSSSLLLVCVTLDITNWSWQAGCRSSRVLGPLGLYLKASNRPHLALDRYYRCQNPPPRPRRV